VAVLVVIFPIAVLVFGIVVVVLMTAGGF